MSELIEEWMVYVFGMWRVVPESDVEAWRLFGAKVRKRQVTEWEDVT